MGSKWQSQLLVTFPNKWFLAIRLLSAHGFLFFLPAQEDSSGCFSGKAGLHEWWVDSEGSCFPDEPRADVWDHQGAPSTEHRVDGLGYGRVFPSFDLKRIRGLQHMGSMGKHSLPGQPGHQGLGEDSRGREIWVHWFQGCRLQQSRHKGIHLSSGYSECLRVNTICVTWKLIRNAQTQASFQTKESEPVCEQDSYVTLKHIIVLEALLL